MSVLQHTRGRVLLGLALLVGLLLTIAGATSARAAQPGPRTWQVTVGIESKDMAIEGFPYRPGEIWIDAGDTVDWTTGSDDLQTVTFLAEGQKRPEFDPNDDQQASQQGGTHYDGKSYYNSGFLSKGSTYNLVFDTPGDYTYIDLVHPEIQGVVHVRPAGTSYPYTQKQYDKQAKKEGEALLARGKGYEKKIKVGKGQVDVGIGDGEVAIMRFLPQKITVHEGQTVDFVNKDTSEPHTVTFGEEQGDPEQPYGDPSAFDGTQPLSSGIMFPDDAFNVTFTKAGTYHYICAFHDMMGMVGDVVVLPNDTK